MSGHTKGPWEASGSDIYRAGHVGVIAARVAWCHSGEVVRERADAHLIAAAPDMLAALTELLAANECAEYPTREEINRLLDAEDAARAAIKKARGEP